MAKKRNKKKDTAPEEVEQVTEEQGSEESLADLELPDLDLEEEPADETEEPTDPMTVLQQQLEEAKVKAAQNWDLLLREKAELENYRKRTQREKEDSIRYANDRLLREMIPVLDNLERAVEHAGENGDESEGLVEGVNMTISMFCKTLESFGVKPVAAVGEAFDPNVHQAMGQVETDEQVPNTVVTEYQKGYLLNDRLLRPSLVMVAKAATSGASDGTENEEQDNA